MSLMSHKSGFPYRAFISIFLLALQLLGAQSGIIELTDENFDEITTGSDKDFLIDIYAPWYASHCQITQQRSRLVSTLWGMKKVMRFAKWFACLSLSSSTQHARVCWVSTLLYNLICRCVHCQQLEPVRYDSNACRNEELILAYHSFKSSPASWQCSMPTTDNVLNGCRPQISPFSTTQNMALSLVQVWKQIAEDLEGQVYVAKVKSSS